MKQIEHVTLGLVIFLASVFDTAVSSANEEEEIDRTLCTETPTKECYTANGRLQLNNGRVHNAIELLKKGIEKYPESGEIAMLLASAYLSDGNDMWAMRILIGYLNLRPDDCEATSQLAWLHIKQGAFDDAEELMKPSVCWELLPMEARRHLLLFLSAKYAEDKEREYLHFKKAYRAEFAFPEDRRLISNMISSDPGYIFPVTGRLDLALGFASNALAGSPTDSPEAGNKEPGPLGQAGALLRFTAPTGRIFRPSAELDVRGLGYVSDTARKLSYVMLGGRPGVVVGWYPNVLLSYRFESLMLAGGDRYEAGPLWFYNAHRGEFEVTLPISLMLFGGAGRREFRESGRSRVELDGGIGGDISFAKNFRLMGVLSGRKHWADKEPYDLAGGSALINLDYRLPKQWMLRAAVLTGLDYYMRSKGYFDAALPETKRFDVLMKLSLGGFSPSLKNGLRFALTYDYSQRFSTTDYYDYHDHRVLLRLQWSFSVNPWLPRSFDVSRHVPIDYGLATADETKERVQDLLRQDEAAQRSSTCVN